MGDDGIGRAKAGSEPALWSSSVASPAPIALLIRPARPRAVGLATVRACARVWPWPGLSAEHAVAVETERLLRWWCARRSWYPDARHRHALRSLALPDPALEADLTEEPPL